MNRIDMPLYDEANEILSRNPNVHDFDEAYAIAYNDDLCTVCDPDNDVDCGWEGKEVYMPIDMNTYFIAYSADSGGNMNTVGITALSMDDALTKWAGQFSDLFVHARSIFKYQPYSSITKVYTVMQEHTITTVTEYKVQY